MFKIFAFTSLLIAAAIPSIALSSEFPFGALGSIRPLGSEPMLVYAFTRPEVGAESFATGVSQLARMGYLGEPGHVTDTWLDLKPFLKSDGNLNGGFPQGELVVAGIPFQVEDESISKGGILLGLASNAGLRMSVAENTSLEISGRARLGWSPRHNLTKQQINSAACLSRMVSTETFLHGCVDYLHASYQLGETNRARGSVGFAYSFMTVAGFHNLTLAIKHDKYLGTRSYDQQIFSINSLSALGNGVGIVANAQIGTSVVGAQVMRSHVEFGLMANMSNRHFAALIAAERSDGGIFLGERREDVSYSVKTTVGINEIYNFSFYYRSTDASHDFFEDESFGIGLDWKI